MPVVSTSSDFRKNEEHSQLRKDRPDLRDLEYKPTLAPLRRILLPAKRLLDGDIEIRTQLDDKAGKEYSDCTGQALAALFDIVSSRMSKSVSARMLFVNGHEIEHIDRGLPSNKNPNLEEGLQSLRSIIKGFYHNGVCEEALYRDERKKAGEEANDADITKSIPITRDARNRPLGSYYRLKPILNDYHAALNEVGAILAAAEIHEGWSHENLKQKGGIIDAAKAAEGDKYMHAFVIVGYNERGFLVLNSWGKEWGNYKPSKDDIAAYTEATDGKGSLPEKIPGVALWTYRDWAERILDGWVLRFGVSAPDAFEYSYGEQGLGGFAEGAISAPSTQRYKVAGHYVHLDDGDFVKAGTLPSTPEQVTATVDFLNARIQGKDAGLDESGKLKPPYHDVLLWIAGGSESTKEVAADIAATKDFWKNAGVYPITVFWCSDFIEKTTELLASTFKSSFEKVGKEGEALDIRIEQDCRGPGRAFWRDIKRSAKWSAICDTMNDGARDRPAGGFMELFQRLKPLDPRIRIHVVAEGAGAILLAEFFGQCASHEADNEFGRISSITLLAPACTRDKFLNRIMDWRRGARGVRAGSSLINLFVLDYPTDRRMKLGYYGGSILSLVQYAFEEKVPERAFGTVGVQKPKRISKTDGTSEIVGLLEAARRLRGDHGDDLELYVLSGGGEGRITKLRDVTFSKSARDQILFLITGGKSGEPPKPDRPRSAKAEGSKPVQAPALSGLEQAEIQLEPQGAK